MVNLVFPAFVVARRQHSCGVLHRVEEVGQKAHRLAGLNLALDHAECEGDRALLGTLPAPVGRSGNVLHPVDTNDGVTFAEPSDVLRLPVGRNASKELGTG